jgi:hypothetical protein
VAERDAELYLRLAGERTVLGSGTGDGDQHSSRLDIAAHALVAVGAMAADAAQAIVDDYDLALSYRDREGHHHRRRAARQATPPLNLGPLRAVPCQRLIEQPWGELFLSYIVLGDDVTTLHVIMRPVLSPPGQPRRRPGHSTTLSAVARVSPVSPAGVRGRGPGGHLIGPGLPRQLRAVDDRGTTAAGGFSGGGDDTEWRGQFELQPALAPGTAWVEVLGERVDLARHPDRPAEVWVEPQPDQDPARSYLWTRLASMGEFRSPEVMEATIDTLVAAGALAEEDPGIAEVRAVVNGLFGGAGTTPAFRAALPEPWRTMMGRRGQAGGPDGLVVVGATTPPFGGFAVAVLAVRSTDEGFSAEVEVVPALAHWHGPRGGVDSPMLAWWARDDLGHHYLGQQDGWHSGQDRSGGEIGFWPALDPAARVLDIMPTTMTARAVIRVPLEWGEER